MRIANIALIVVAAGVAWHFYTHGESATALNYRIDCLEREIAQKQEEVGRLRTLDSSVTTVRAPTTDSADAWHQPSSQQATATDPTTVNREAARLDREITAMRLELGSLREKLQATLAREGYKK